MLKKIIAVILCVCMMPVAAIAESFSDVAGHWAESEVKYATENKIVNGYSDGTFKPNNTVTRAEFVKMLTASICTTLQIDTAEYADETHWVSQYYNFAIESGMLVTMPEAVFDGVQAASLDATTADYQIKRWEMAYMLYCVLVNVFQAQTDAVSYADEAQTAEIYDENIAVMIGACIDAGLLKGDEKGNFNAAKNGTRAEAATIVNRVDRLMKDIIKQNQEALAKEEQRIQEKQKTYDVIPEGHPEVELTMEKGGKIIVELYPEYAPQTVANFVALVNEGFYDGLTFHRVIEGFMAQGGDPKGNGTGESDGYIKGEFAANEFAQNTLKHERGTISMARGEHPNTASCQFFICYDDASYLDGNYAAFGKVKKGMEVVDAFLDVEREMSAIGEISVPKEKIVIKTAKVIK